MKIRDIYINLEAFKEDIEYFKTLQWSFSKWEATPAIIDKSGTRSKYMGQNFNPKYWELKEDGWSHDDCEICTLKLFDSEFAFENYGYKNDEEDWLCFECYKKLIDENYKENLYVVKEKFELSIGKSVLFISPIIETQKLKITANSKFGNCELEYYIDKPRKKLKSGKLDDQTFAIILQNKKEIVRFEKDVLYEFENQ